jgi:hypothetical protein
MNVRDIEWQTQQSININFYRESSHNYAAVARTPDLSSFSLSYAFHFATKSHVTVALVRDNDQQRQTLLGIEFNHNIFLYGRIA